MKTAALFALSALLLFARQAHSQSIQNLPILSTLIIHHFDCRAAILPGAGQAKELMFQVLPDAAGHQGHDISLTNGTDSVVATVNTQMLQLTWSRGVQVVAAAQTMIQMSPTQAYVLIVVDPKDDSNQVHLSCNAVTYADLKRGVK